MVRHPANGALASRQEHAVSYNGLPRATTLCALEARQRLPMGTRYPSVCIQVRNLHGHALGVYHLKMILASDAGTFEEVTRSNRRASVAFDLSLAVLRDAAALVRHSGIDGSGGRSRLSQDRLIGVGLQATEAHIDGKRLGEGASVTTVAAVPCPASRRPRKLPGVSSRLQWRGISKRVLGGGARAALGV